MAVARQAVPEPVLVHPVRVGVHDGHVAEYLDAVARRVGDVERVVLAPETVPLGVRGAVYGRPPEDFDSLLFEIRRPAIQLRAVLHLERDVVQARLQGEEGGLLGRGGAFALGPEDEVHVVVKLRAPHEAKPEGEIAHRSRLEYLGDGEAQRVDVKILGRLDVVHLYGGVLKPHEAPGWSRHVNFSSVSMSR